MANMVWHIRRMSILFKQTGPLLGLDGKTLDRQQRQAQIIEQAQRASERGLVLEFTGDLRYLWLIRPAF